jgi:hypothetical protein
MLGVVSFPIDVGYEPAMDASISTTTRATLMLPTLLENNRRLSHPPYCSWNRHGTVLLGHAVMDATVAWLDPTDNRAHNRVVSKLPLEVACERASVYLMNETGGRACRQSERT